MQQFVFLLKLDGIRSLLYKRKEGVVNEKKKILFGAIYVGTIVTSCNSKLIDAVIVSSGSSMEINPKPSIEAF